MKEELERMWKCMATVLSHYLKYRNTRRISKQILRKIINTSTRLQYRRSYYHHRHYPHHHLHQQQHLRMFV
jgi:hypothetical protein